MANIILFGSAIIVAIAMLGGAIWLGLSWCKIREFVALIPCAALCVSAVLLIVYAYNLWLIPQNAAENQEDESFAIMCNECGYQESNSSAQFCAQCGKELPS